jgi:hypothetical protein
MFLRLYALKESPLEIRTCYRTWLCDTNLPSISCFDVVMQKLMLLEIIYAVFPHTFLEQHAKSPLMCKILLSFSSMFRKTLSKWHS